MPPTLWPGVRIDDTNRADYPPERIFTCPVCTNPYYRANVADRCWQCAYEGVFIALDATYRDVLDVLNAIDGITAATTQTGGMCLAIEITPDDSSGRWLLTDREDTLSAERDPADGWALGWYPGGDEDDGCPTIFLDRTDKTAETAADVMAEGLALLREKDTKRMRVTIKRRFAVMLEDAIEADLPDGIDPTDSDAVEEWAHGDFDDLYVEAVNARDSMAKGEPPLSTARVLWEDRAGAAIESVDDEYECEVQP